MRSIYIFLIIFITNFAYAETTYICRTINGNDKTVYEIKRNKLFIDGKKTNTLKIKVNKLISEFEYKSLSSNKIEAVILKLDKYDYFDTKVTHKVDLTSGHGFEFYESKVYKKRMKDDVIIGNFSSRSSRELLKCYGFSISN